MFVIQCALVGILYYISNVYSSFGGFIVSKYMLQRPLIGGFLCGLIFGDLRTGLEIGVALQLAFMGVFAGWSNQYGCGNYCLSSSGSGNY